MQGHAWKISAFRLPRFGFRPLSILLGMFLLTTAALKAHGLTIDPLAQDSFLSSARLLVATIEIEVILGLWLLSGWWPKSVWAITLGFFGVLAIVSFYFVSDGQSSCGCLGRVTVSPWLMLGLDVGILGWLLLSPPAGPAEIHSRFWLPATLMTSIASVSFVVLFSALFLFPFNSPVKVLAQLRGEPLAVLPSVIDVGEGIPGEWRTFDVSLTNCANVPIRIVGGSTNCSCIATDDLPVTIPPGESRSIEVRMKFKAAEGRFHDSFKLFTDNDEQRVAVGRLIGRIRPRDAVR